MTCSLHRTLASLTIGLLAASLMTSLAAEAQPVAPASASASSPESTTFDRAIVVGVKDPLEVPYKRGYTAAQKIAQASANRVELVLTLVDKAPPPMPDLRLTLEYDDTVRDLALDARRSFVFPIDIEAERHDARFVVNRKRGNLDVQIDLRPRIAEGPFTVQGLSGYVAAARAVRVALLPWYARALTPTVNTLRACSVSADARFALRNAVGRELALDTLKAKDMFGRPASCADFFGAEDARQPGAGDDIVLLPHDATFDFTGSLF